MKRMLMLFALLVTTPLFAARWIVPAAASAAGAANTRWKTDLRLVNPDASRGVTARVHFLNAGTDNSALGTSITVDVPANGQVVLADVVSSRFNVNGTGALLVDAASPLIVTSRTFNDTGAATFGQFVPGVATEHATGETTHIVYLAKTAEYRSNVGFAGTSANGGNVTVTLFDANSVRLGSGTFAISPYGQVQVNDIFAATGAAPAAAARAEITANVPVVAYGSIIDNRTGDPIAIIAQHRGEASRELTIPAVAHADGANSSVWRSDLRLFNPDEEQANVTLTYYPSSGAAMTHVITIGGRQTASLEDIVATTFHANGVGAMRITSNRELLAASRTYNALPGGTFGQDVRVLPASETVQANQVARLSGLTNDGYRTNLGLFNLGSAPLELSLELRGAGGASLATRTQRLEGHQMLQQDVFALMGVSAATTASLSISTTSGNSAYAAYASIVDNRSGDPVFVPASISAAVQQGGGGGDCAVVPFISSGRVTHYNSVINGTTSTWVNTVTSDAAGRYVSNDVVNTPGAPTMNIDNVFDFDVANNLRLIRHAVSEAKTSVSGFAITVKTDMSFAPSMPTAPLPGTEWCVGRKWDVPAVATTVVVTGTIPGPTTVVNRGATFGEILEVGTLNTQAGPHRAVKIRTVQASEDEDVKYSIMWYSTEYGIFLRQESYSPSDSLVSTMEVTAIH